MSFRLRVDNPTSVDGERENGGGAVKLGFISEIGRNNENSFKKWRAHMGNFPPFHESLLCLGKLPESFWKF